MQLILAVVAASGRSSFVVATRLAVGGALTMRT